MPKLTPSLWFDGQAEEAANYYASIFEDSKVGRVGHFTEAGPGTPGSVLAVEFELNGQKFVGLNGGPEFTFNEAISFQIFCKDQEEIDYYWDALLADGGQESECGWLKDRFGVSWQIVPKRLQELLDGDDRDGARRAMEAMLGMVKLDIAELEAARRGG